jgi:hypothetical protein
LASRELNWAGGGATGLIILGFSATIDRPLENLEFKKYYDELRTWIGGTDQFLTWFCTSMPPYDVAVLT